MGQTIAKNRKAFRDYNLTDKWECGIALIGAEVKSLRAGHVDFKDSFASIEKDEAYLYNLHINPYEQAGIEDQQPDRKRKLLLHKREIKKILAATLQKNFTLMPTRIYFNNRGLAKVEIALARGKRQFDKRETIKKRSIDRDIERTLKQRKR